MLLLRYPALLKTIASENEVIALAVLALLLWIIQRSRRTLSPKRQQQCHEPYL